MGRSKWSNQASRAASSERMPPALSKVTSSVQERLRELMEPSVMSMATWRLFSGKKYPFSFWA